MLEKYRMSILLIGVESAISLEICDSFYSSVSNYNHLANVYWSFQCSFVRRFRDKVSYRLIYQLIQQIMCCVMWSRSRGISQVPGPLPKGRDDRKDNRLMFALLYIPRCLQASSVMWISYNPVRPWEIIYIQLYFKMSVSCIVWATKHWYFKCYNLHECLCMENTPHE